MLDSRSSGPDLSPGRGSVLCSLARHFTLTVTVFAQVLKWVPVDLLLGVKLPSQHWYLIDNLSRGSCNLHEQNATFTIEFAQASCQVPFLILPYKLGNTSSVSKKERKIGYKY